MARIVAWQGPGASTGTSVRRGLIALVLAMGIALHLAGESRAQGDAPVIVAPIEGEIDLGLAPFLERVLTEAAESGAAAVVLPIDTPGGRLDAALEIRRSLLASEVGTLAFIDATALSAGALIAIAAEEVATVPAGVMGAATPVLGATGETADPKVVSAVRSTFRATALQRDRDPAIAEAMVDPALEVEGVAGAGELVTLDAEQMLQTGYADHLVDSLEELLAEVGLADAPLERSEPSLAERLVRFLTGSLVAPLLLSVGVWLLVGDLLSGGVGIGAAVGSVLLGAFFYGHLLAGLSGWEDILLVGAGIVLLLVEIFVIPGTGVTGILGLLALLGGGVLAMVNRDLDLVPMGELVAVAGRVTATFLAVSVVLITLIVLIARRRGGGEGLILAEGSQGSGARPGRARWLQWFGSSEVLAPDLDEAAESDTTRDPRGRPDRLPRGALLGRHGVALSDLRPAGVARIGGHRIDVVTEGEWLSAGDPVVVITDEGYRRVVRRAEPGEVPAADGQGTG